MYKTNEKKTPKNAQKDMRRHWAPETAVYQPFVVEPKPPSLIPLASSSTVMPN